MKTNFTVIQALEFKLFFLEFKLLVQKKQKTTLVPQKINKSNPDTQKFQLKKKNKKQHIICLT